MAFTKTTERGSDKINSSRSTLDLSNTYWFPRKCTDERFPSQSFNTTRMEKNTNLNV